MFIKYRLKELVNKHKNTLGFKTITFQQKNSKKTHNKLKQKNLTQLKLWARK